MTKYDFQLDYSKKDFIYLFEELLRIRRAEEAIVRRYAEQAMRCPTHLSVGQEAIPVGVSMHLRNKDHVYSNHRSHGHYLAKGGSLPKMIAEFYGKATGCCGGRGGSMHLVDLQAGFMGSTPIVGGTIPLAVGDAWSASLKGIDRVSVVYFGDGCFEEGVIHEVMNFAVLHCLPVIFVCENNGYSVYTQLNERQGSRSIIGIAAAHGLETYKGDGNNVLDVSKIAYEAITKARKGMGPQFMEFETYRWLEHCGPLDDDDLGYRPSGELEKWKGQCAVKKLLKYMLEGSYITEYEIAGIESKVNIEVNDAFDFALSSSNPEADQMKGHIYA